MSAGDRCGGRWNCVLPAGHNMGKADIPENHQPPSAGDRDTLRQLIAQHYAVGWFNCSCGVFASDGLDHLEHLADVIASSDWLREQRAEAWDEGWKEHGIDSGSCTCQFCFFGYTDDRDRLNPYRRTEK